MVVNCEYTVPARLIFLSRLSRRGIVNFTITALHHQHPLYTPLSTLNSSHQSATGFRTGRVGGRLFHHWNVSTSISLVCFLSGRRTRYRWAHSLELPRQVRLSADHINGHAIGAFVWLVHGLPGWYPTYSWNLHMARWACTDLWSVCNSLW